MATVVYEVTAPDGTVLEVSGPEGASEAEVMAQAKKLYKSKPVEPQGKPGTSMSDMLGMATRALATSSPLSFLARGAESAAPQTLEGLGQATQDVQAGLGGGMSSTVEGIRQAANVGDPEELSQLNAETLQRRQALAKLTEQNPGLAGAGEVAGEVLPYLLGGGVAGAGLKAAAPALAAPQGALALGGLGAATGGAQGFASALTPEEEAAGERAGRAGTGALMGGALGAAAPPVSQFLTKRLPDALARMLPEDALDDFLSRTTGKADDTAKLYEDITRKTGEKISGLDDRFTKAYTKVEGPMWEKAGSPPVLLKSDSLFNSPDLMGSTRELLAAKKPIREVMNAINSARSGTGLSAVPYPTATAAIRDLNKIGSNTKAPEGAQTMAQSLAAELRNNIDETTHVFPEVKPLINKQQQISDAWKNMMVPMRDAGEGAPVGTWNAGGRTQKDFEDIFLSGKSGSQLKDLFARVPEVEGDVRKLWGTTRGAQPEIRRELASSTTRDVMFKNPEEREYASKLSKYLRGGPKDEGMGTLQELGKKIGGGRYHPVMNMMMSERLARGILPYGQKARKMTDAEKLASALRATTLGVVPMSNEELDED